MKDLSNEKMMTVKEIMNALECPKQTVIDSINRLFPGKMKARKTTYLNEVEITKISMDLKRARCCTSTRTAANTSLERKLLRCRQSP